MLILPFVLVALSLAWSAVAIDVVVESAPVGGRELWAFGHLLATPGVPAGIWILCGVSATAALAMVAAVAHVRGRRLERRMAAELDDARAEMARRSAGDTARTTLLSWRVAELQTLVDRLIAERGLPDGRLVTVPDATEGVGAHE
jgi:hypothetical protein